MPKDLDNHELQELFYEAAETDGVRIQNTGYYPLTETMWEALNNVDSETFENVVNLPDDDEVIVYHEWW